MKNLLLSTLILLLFTACSSRPSSTYSSGKITPVLAGINLNDAKKYVQQGRVNEKAKSLGNTALIYSATNSSHIKVTEYLLRNGANINYKNKGNISALTQALHSNNIQGAELLINFGANIQEKDAAGRNLLFTSLSKGDIQTSKVLLNKGLKIQKGTKNELYKQIDIYENAKSKYPQYAKIYNTTIFNINKGINFLDNKSEYISTSTQPIKKTNSKLEKQIKKLEEKKNYLALKKLNSENPETLYYLSNEDMKLLFTGPKNLRVGDIKELIKKKKSPLLIISLVKRVKQPYKEFSLEEIDKLSKLGIPDNIISAMLDITTKLKENKTASKVEQKVQTKVIYKTQPAPKQNNTLGNEVQKQLINEGAKRLFKALF